MQTNSKFGIICFRSILSGCMTASEHKESLQPQVNTDESLTVGTVQRTIEIGMSGAQVIEALGSPNIVSTDAKRREVWVYDKISTDKLHSNSSGGILAQIFFRGLTNTTSSSSYGSNYYGSQFYPIGSSINLNANGKNSVTGGYNEGSGAISETQRTLTIIIKFDESKNVRDFSYRTSRF